MVQVLLSSERSWDMEFITCLLFTKLGRRAVANGYIPVQATLSFKLLPDSNGLINSGHYQLSETGMVEASL